MIVSFFASDLRCVFDFDKIVCLCNYLGAADVILSQQTLQSTMDSFILREVLFPSWPTPQQFEPEERKYWLWSLCYMDWTNRAPHFLSTTRPRAL